MPSPRHFCLSSGAGPSQGWAPVCPRWPAEQLASGERDGVGKRCTAGAEHGNAGTSCPGVSCGSRPTAGTLSRFLEAAPDPADPCRFPPAIVSQLPLPNVLEERSQVRQSGDKSELTLAALVLCLGLIGGSGSPPAPLTRGLGWLGWQPGLLAGSCRRVFSMRKVHVCLSSDVIACEGGRRQRMC